MVVLLAYLAGKQRILQSSAQCDSYNDVTMKTCILLLSFLSRLLFILVNRKLISVIRSFWLINSDVTAGIHKDQGWQEGDDAYPPYNTSKLGIITLAKVCGEQMANDPREDILVNSVRYYCHKVNRKVLV